MNDNEKAMLKRLKEILPTLPDQQKMFILGYGEALADMKQEKEQEVSA